VKLNTHFTIFTDHEQLMQSLRMPYSWEQLVSYKEKTKSQKQKPKALSIFRDA
jgi:hypothetical protein